MVRRHMRRMLMAVAAVGLLTSAGVPQGGGPRQGPGGGRRGAGGAGGTRGMGHAASMDEALGSLGLSKSEQKAVKDAMEKKRAAYRSLADRYDRLQRTASEKKVSDAVARRAVAEYLSARDQAERQMNQIDRDLMKQLSPGAQLKVLALGVVNNGVGRGMRRMGGGGGRGGTRGGGGRGGGRGAGRASRYPPPGIVAPGPAKK